MMAISAQNKIHVELQLGSGVHILIKIKIEWIKLNISTGEGLHLIPYHGMPKASGLYMIFYYLNMRLKQRDLTTR